MSTAWRPDDERVHIAVDHTLGHDSLCVTLECDDRQGLVYDVLCTVHTMGVKVVQAQCRQAAEGRAELHIFLKDAAGSALASGMLLRPLLHRLRKAVLMPVCVSVRDPLRCMSTSPGVVHNPQPVPCERWQTPLAARAQVTQAREDPHLLDVRVYAVPDSGGQGRPRVLLDTTSVLRAARMPLLRAFVGMVDVDAVPEAVPASHLGRLASTLSVPLLQVRRSIACD